MRCVWLLLAACTCRSAPPDDSADTGAAVAGVLRLGPPAPAVGIYGLAAHPDGSRLYLSNLHVPFVTVIDTATGAWSDALDLREQGQEHTNFQHLFVADGALLATDQDRTGLLRWSLEDHSVLEPIALGGPYLAGRVTDEGLWVALPDTLLRYQGTAVASSFPLPLAVQAFDVEADRVALVGKEDGEVLLYDGGALAWQRTLAETTLNDVLLVEDEVWITDRASGDLIVLAEGEERDRVHLGSDAFALARHGDRVLATCRQGAALPASGAYEGAPGTVLALSLDHEVVWEVAADKTVHFLAFDGQWWWVAAEDALRMVAIDPEAGEVVLRGPRVGLTLDHLLQDGDRLFVPSHLTDEVLVIDRGDERLTSVPSCGWPLVGALQGGQLTVICQESGELQRLDPTSLEQIAMDALGSTFHPPCADGLCSGHDVLVDLAPYEDTLVFSDMQLPGVRWDDGRAPVALPMPEERMQGLQHFAVSTLGEVLLAYEPRSSTLWRVAGGVATDSMVLPTDGVELPVVPQGARAWVGSAAVDADLAVVAELPDGARVVLATEAWVLALEGTELVTYASDDLTERARLSVDALRAPPLVHDRTEDSRGPLRFLALSPELLLVANTFRGTLELRALPGLEPVGDDEVVPLGAWAGLPGLR